jgi:hypothetical protein
MYCAYLLVAAALVALADHQQMELAQRLFTKQKTERAIRF